MNNRTTLVLASFALLAAALTGCGGGAGAGADAGTGDDPTGSESARHEQMLDYAQCLREHGIEVEDPKPGEGIRLQMQGPDDEQKVREADEACKEVAPPPPGDGDGPPEDREGMLETARCMREHGVEAFPDPKPGEGLNLVPEAAEDPDFEEAQRTCMPGAPVPEREEKP